jgi:pilus assembly protein Flp/PilA
MGSTDGLKRWKGCFPEAGQLGPFASSLGGDVNSSRLPQTPNWPCTAGEDVMFGLIKSLWNDESGATAVEYGIMVALIAVAIIVAVAALGDTLNGLFESVETELGNV